MKLVFNRKDVYYKYILSLVCLLLIVVGRVLYLIDSDLGFVVLLSFVVFSSFLFLGVQKDYLIIFICLSSVFLFKLSFGVENSPIVGTDEYLYYQQVLDYINKPNEYFTYLVSKISLKDTIYPAFGIIFMPFFYLVGSIDESIIILLNTLFLFMLAWLVLKLVWKLRDNTLHDGDVSVVAKAATLGVLLSPSLLYWSSTFAKDTTSIVLCFIALHFLINKKYIRFILFLFISTLMRPYSIAIIGVYYLIYKRSLKLSLFSVVLSILIVLFFSGGLTGLVNTFVTSGYLLLAPNPFDILNWKNYWLMSAESLIITFLGVVSFYVFIKYKRSRSFILVCALSFYIYACTMTAVGNYVIGTNDLDYIVGSVGDNMTRKKLPIIPLLYILIGLSISKIIKK